MSRFYIDAPPRYVGAIALTGNFKIAATRKPNFIHRWLMRVCFGFKWENTPP